MTILLIEPYTAKTFVENLEEPLLLEYAAHSLISDSRLEGCEVLALDMRIEGDMEVCLKSINCDGEIWVMCFGCGNTEAIQKVFCNIKALFPQAVTIAAGCGVLEAPIVDVSIYDGEPGSVLADLIASDRQTDNNDFYGVAGVSFFSDGSFKTTEQKSCAMPEGMPNRDITSCYRKNYKYLGEPAAWMLDCKPYSGGAEKRKPAIIVKEIQEIVEGNIVFSNIKKISDAKWLKELAVNIKDSGTQKKYHFTVAPTLVLANPHLFSLWKSIGLTSVSLEERSDASSKNAKSAAALLGGIGLKAMSHK